MASDRSAFWLGCVPGATALLVVTLVSAASGDIIGQGTERTIQHGSASIDMWFVNVGDKGNAPDVYGAGYGAVPYNYEIGEFAVTAGQYETVRADAGLDNRGSTDLSTGDQPVNFVSWFEAARFTNWLTSGNPNLGAYDTSAAGWGSAAAYTGSGVARDSVAMSNLTNTYGKVYFLPSEDEWYKAAYYEGGSTNAGYWMYPTGSNTVPTAVAGGVLPGTVVYGQSDWSGGGRPADVDNAGGRSAYDTMGQDGNVWEWNETLSGSRRLVRGGSFSNNASYLPASYRHPGDPPTNEHRRVGFRVASTAGIPTDMIANGGFETVIGGKFVGWNYLPATGRQVATVASHTPEDPILGDYSARMVAGATDGGRLWQEVGETGVSDFIWTLTFAVQPFTAGTYNRSLSICTYSVDANPSDLNTSSHNLDSIRVIDTGEIQVFHAGGFKNTGLLVDTSSDLDDPAANILTYLGAGFGTGSPSFTITLDNSLGTRSYSGNGPFVTSDAALRYFVLAGDICAVDWLVDNVSFHVVPEPSTSVLLAWGLVGLLACTRRRRK